MAAYYKLDIHSLKPHSITQSRQQRSKPSHMCCAHPGGFSCTSRLFHEAVVGIGFNAKVTISDHKLLNVSVIPPRLCNTLIFLGLLTHSVGAAAFFFFFFPEPRFSRRDRVVFVCVCLKQAEPLTGRGCVRAGGGGARASINTVSMEEAHGPSDPTVNFRGGCRGRGERPEVSIHAHDKQCERFARSTERRQSPQAAHMSPATHSTNSPVVPGALLCLTHIRKIVYS